jgi:hypothetical protein
MASIEQLERMVLRMQQELDEKTAQMDALLRKSEKALDQSLHAYRVDEYGYIWVYDPETSEYHSTKMRVMSPEIADKAIHTKHIADGAVTGDKIDDKAVTAQKLADNTIPGRCIADLAIDSTKIPAGAVTADKLANGSITGDHMEGETAVPGKIANNAVQTRNILNRNVTLPKLGDDVMSELAKLEDLQNQIDSLEVSGLALSNIFGGDPHIGISQKKLSWFANYVLTMLEEALGRTLLGFTWEVTPTYIYGEWPTTVHITAQPTNDGDYFEHIWLYSNDELVNEVTEPTPSYEFDIDLQQSVNIRLEAQLLGEVYERNQRVNHYDSFWLGGGATYADIMNQAHNINFSEGTRLAKDVTVADGEHIIIMMGDAWVPAFIRADMNGSEIEFDETTVTIDGKNYKVLTSKSVFEAGTYNIDING